MKLLATIATGWVLTFTAIHPTAAHTNGATTVHEITEAAAPKATLSIKKDPTGGFNVYVQTSNFIWRPEMASMQHVVGEGHAHVFLDGRKIMRIYNQWFHLNTYQFANKSGEQLLSIEFVGNDHAAYTVKGLPVGAEQLVDVPIDEIAPNRGRSESIYVGAIALLLIVAAVLVFRLKGRKEVTP